MEFFNVLFAFLGYFCAACLAMEASSGVQIDSDAAFLEEEIFSFRVNDLDSGTLPEFMQGDFAFRRDLSPGFDKFLFIAFDGNEEQIKEANKLKVTEKITQEEETGRISLDTIQSPLHFPLLIPSTFTNFFFGVPWKESDALQGLSFITKTSVEGVKLFMDREEEGCQGKLCFTREVREFKDEDGDGIYETMVNSGIKKIKEEFVPFVRTFKRIADSDETLTEDISSDHISLDVGPNNETCFNSWEYGKFEYRDKETTCCTTEFQNVCTRKIKRVCLNVTEVWCKAVARADCKAEMVETNFTECARVDKQFNETVCTDETATVFGTSKVSMCKNVTKLNCVGDWEVGADGSEVWKGEKCSPLVWEECSLKEVKTPFNITKQNCSTGSPHWWTDCQNATTTRDYVKTNCTVKESVECTPAVREDCTTLEYDECDLEPVEKCQNKIVKEPFQERTYRKSCILLPEDIALNGDIAKGRNIDAETIEILRGEP